MADENSYICPTCQEPFPTGVALGGHRKTHNAKLRAVARRLAAQQAIRDSNDPRSVMPPPECFESEDQWRYSCQKLLDEFPERRLSRSMAFKEACAVCTLSYQRFAQAQGTCRPEPGAQTPELRAARGVDDQADEPLAVAS